MCMWIMSSITLQTSYITVIIQIWFEVTVGYTCFGFTFMSFQCFKPMPSVQLQTKFLYNFQLHSVTNFFSCFHYWTVFSLPSTWSSLLLGKKELFCSTAHLSEFFPHLCLAFPTLVCPGNLLGEQGSFSHRGCLLMKRSWKNSWD